MSQHPAFRQAQKRGKVTKLCFNCCFTHTNHSRPCHGDHANETSGMSENGWKKILLSPPISSLLHCTISHRMTYPRVGFSPWMRAEMSLAWSGDEASPVSWVGFQAGAELMPWDTVAKAKIPVWVQCWAGIILSGSQVALCSLRDHSPAQTSH